MTGRKHTFDFDVAVIGGGSGGYAAARTTAHAGLRTVVIEGGDQVGGLCILRGCMPTKALLHAAEVLHLARRAGAWGLLPGRIGFDFAEVMRRKDRLIQEFADYRTSQLTSGRFEFVRARARFTDEHTVELDTGSIITAAHFVISTGSTVAPPPLADLNAIGYLTSDDALTLTRLPGSLVILGGGAVAIEFAQFFARFDVEVTVVQRSPQILKEFDPDAVTELQNALAREGIRFHCDTALTGARKADGLKAVQFSHAGRSVEVAAEEVFHGLGRIPNTLSLGLENAGVRTDRGRVTTNERMQTSTPHIFAAGDCTSPYEIVHIAIQQGEIAAHNIAHPDRPRSIDYRLQTSVVFTEPQLATVGLTEKEAGLRGIPWIAASHRFDDHGKSLIMEARDGLVKLLANPESGEILGGCVVGPVGGELIHEIIAAMYRRMTVHELAAMPHYHPTLAEIWTYPAEELADQIPSTHRP